MSEIDAPVTPEGFRFRPDGMKTEPTEDERQDEAEERQLAALTKSAGWHLFQERVQARIMALRTMAGVDLSKMTFEQIGQRTMAAHLAADTVEAELVAINTIAEEIDQNGEK